MAISSRSESMVDRNELIGEIDDLLLLIKGSVIDQLKKMSDLPAIEKHKIGVLKDVVNKADQVFNIYGFSTIPIDKDLQKNIVYVDYSRKQVRYIVLCALGQSTNVVRYEGIISVEELPNLKKINTQLVFPLQPLLVDILKILVDRKHIQFKLDDSNINQIDDVLRAVLAARDDAFALEAAKLDKVYGYYYKKNNIGISKDDITDGLKRLYFAIYELSYRLMRQRFCLEQFSIINVPEKLGDSIDILISKLQHTEEQLAKCNFQVLQAEHEQFQEAFQNLIKHIELDSSAKPFAEVAADDVSPIAQLRRAFKQELEWLPTISNIKEMQTQAEQAAKLGDGTGLHAIQAVAKRSIERIKNVRDRLDKIILDYTQTFNERVTHVLSVYHDHEKTINSVGPNVLNVTYLKSVAMMMENKQPENDYDKTHPLDEFDALKKDAQLFADISRQLDGTIRSNGWGAIGKDIQDKMTQLTNELHDYANLYLQKRQIINKVTDAYARVCGLHANAVEACNNISEELFAKRELWRVMQANLDAKWKKPFNELLYIKPNGVTSFIRRHWGKMLIGGVILAALVMPVAFFVLGLSLVVAAVVGAAAMIAGIAVGASVGAITDTCCKAKPTMEFSLDTIRAKRSSSAEAMQEFTRAGGEENPTKLNEIKIVADSSDDEQTPEKSTDLPTENLFDGMELDETLFKPKT
jgi:hypothetical protein